MTTAHKRTRRKAKPNDRRRQNKGQPRTAFRSGPDRIAIAFATVLRELGATKKGATEIAVAVMHGRPVALKQSQRHGRGLTMLDMDYELIRGHGATTSIPVGAKRLRRKIKRAIGDEDALQP